MLELLYKRRSIRKFTAEKISTEDRERLTEALLLSPSSMNKRAWRFIIIEDEDIIRKMTKAKQHGTTALTTAPLVIAVIGKIDITDVWVEDCSIASIIAQLTAESLELGSCWIQIRLRMAEDGITSAEYMKTLLDIKENESLESLIAIGHPAETMSAYTKEDLDFSMVELL